MRWRENRNRLLWESIKMNNYYKDKDGYAVASSCVGCAEIHKIFGDCLDELLRHK